MGAILDFPARSPTLASVAANRAQAEAFMASPRGRFLTACSTLVTLGYEVTADDAIFAYRSGFQREDLIPNPDHMAKAFAALASIPPADVPAARQARVGLLALAAIALPFNDEPEVA